jgi:hypothetical protein
MIADKRRWSSVLMSALWLGALAATHVHAQGADVSVPVEVLYESADGIYVSTAKNAGLEKGEIGWLDRAGQPLVRIEVVSSSGGSSLLKVAGARPDPFPAAGEKLAVRVVRTARDAPPERKRSGTLKDRKAADAEPAELSEGSVDAPTIPDGSKPGELPETVTDPEAQDPAAPKPPQPFVPLLAGDKGDVGAYTDAFNIWQGQAWVRQLFQVTPGGDYDYFVTHVGTSGSLERIEGTPWAFEWSGDLSYRDGAALDDVEGYRELRFDLYRLSVFRRFDSQSSVRLGRFLPRELPSVGYLDGAQGEYVINESFRIGGILGLKPDRIDLDFSIEEPTQVGYLTMAFGDSDLSYNATAGMLLSVYKGKFDRLAMLADQALRWGNLSVLSSSEIGFDIGAAETNEGVRLNRLDLVATYPVFTNTLLRAGIDRYEKPDTAAERDVVPAFVLEDEEFFDRGYWRYFVGATHELPWKLRLSEEVSVMDAPEEDWTLRWNVSLTRTGLPLLPPSSSLTLTVYNLLGEDIEGYGGRLTGHIPLPGNKVFLQPAAAFRFLESDLFGTDEFYFTDVSLHAYWTINKHWSLRGGASYAFADDDDIQRILVDVGVTFRW